MRVDRIGGTEKTFCEHRNSIAVSDKADSFPMPDEVHIWSAPLTSSLVQLQAFSETLSDDERRRAASYIRTSDRNKYINARGILRALLGTYLGIDPQQVCFSYNDYGKPCLTQSSFREVLRFNLSHAGNSVVFVFSQSRSVGIDIEPFNPNLAWWELATIIFSVQQIRVFNELPKCEKLKAFIHGWTHKEAFVKACGLGFSLDLKTFNVPLIQPESAILVDSSLNISGDEFYFYPINPLSGFISALCVSGSVLRHITINAYHPAGEIALKYQ